MPVIDVSNDFKQLAHCWFPQALNIARQQLSPAEWSDAVAWIERHIFDEALSRPNGRMNVTHAVREFIPTHPDWTGSPLQPLYDRTGQDPEHAARIYGNLVCEVGIQRPETWWCFPEPVAEDRMSRSYVADSAMRAQVHGRLGI